MSFKLIIRFKKQFCNLNPWHLIGFLPQGTKLPWNSSSDLPVYTRAEKCYTWVSELALMIQKSLLKRRSPCSSPVSITGCIYILKQHLHHSSIKKPGTLPAKKGGCGGVCVCFSGRLATPWDLLTGGWPVRSPDIRVTPADRAITAFPRGWACRWRLRAVHPLLGLQSQQSALQGGLAKHRTRQADGQGTGRGTAGEVARILHRAWRSLRLEGQDLAPTSTKASVRSLARSITGKWRPATIFTFSFPGIVSASASSRAPAETNKRVCAERPAWEGEGGSARGTARGRGDARGNWQRRARGGALRRLVLLTLGRERGPSGAGT